MTLRDVDMPASLPASSEDWALEKIEVTDRKASYVVGGGGSRIREIREHTGANVLVEACKPDGFRTVKIWGHRNHVAKAAAIVRKYLTVATDESDPTYFASGFTIGIEIDAAMMGRVIGRGGENIRQMQHLSGAHVQVEREDEPDYVPPPAGLRRVLITGSSEAKRKARDILDGLLDGTRPDGDLQRSYQEADAAEEAAAADIGPIVTEEMSISDGALKALVDPANPTPLGQLRRSRAAVMFSRARHLKRSREADGPAAGNVTGAAGDGGGEAGEAKDGAAESAAEGSRTVLIRGTATALHLAKMILAEAEARFASHAALVKAQSERKIVAAEEALYKYYLPYYERAGLPYATPAKLWIDEVDAESSQFKMWVNYYKQQQPGVADATAAHAGSAARRGGRSALGPAQPVTNAAPIPQPTPPASAAVEPTQPAWRYS